MHVTWERTSHKPVRASASLAQLVMHLRLVLLLVTCVVLATSLTNHNLHLARCAMLVTLVKVYLRLRVCPVLQDRM
jgi:hypothetical protein